MLRHGERSLHPLHLRDEVNGAEVTGDEGEGGMEQRRPCAFTSKTGVSLQEEERSCAFRQPNSINL